MSDTPDEIARLRRLLEALRSSRERAMSGEIGVALAAAKRARKAAPERYPADFDWVVGVLEEALAEVERLRKSLKEVEWDKHDATCPICNTRQPSSAAEHAAGCWLGAELYPEAP